jgi:excinuclease UvrABC ATPase subunit
MEDIRVLVELLQALVDKGHTVLVIEHQVDLLRAADYLVDLGPEGGAGGGNILWQGFAKDWKAMAAGPQGGSMPGYTLPCLLGLS